MRQPAFYIPHGGGPCFFMEWTMGPADTWDRLAVWLKGFVRDLPERPKAILLVSAHWEAPRFTVSSAERPAMYYDYYGFPPHTYELQFPAPGSPALAARIRGLLAEAGIAADEDAERGFDHATFVPLLLATPDADIPVVQLSLKAGFDPTAHIAAGRALAPLRDEGVLIIGSGSSWHSGGRGSDPRSQSIAFDDWLTHALSDPAHRADALIQWEQAPAARVAHGREEHLAPLFVVAGAAEGEPYETAFRDAIGGRATMQAAKFS
jgi:aromatic ring-opening dioxygenase catalytic subunit (LigB family)